MFGGLLLAGTLAFCGRPLRRGIWPAGWQPPPLFALVMGLTQPSLDRLVVVQTVLIVPALPRLGVVPAPAPAASRRGLGTRITGGVFLLQSLLWMLYAIAFALVWLHGADADLPESRSPR